MGSPDSPDDAAQDKDDTVMTEEVAMTTLE